MRSAVSLVTLLLSSASLVAGPYDSLLTVVPATTNTLVLINGTAIYGSPLAKAQKWADAYGQRFKAGVNTIPIDAKVAVIACCTNMRDITREWQVALTKVPQVANARTVAARESGSVDEIAGRFAVLSPRDVYFTSISEEETAAWYPANRQLLSHWLRNVKSWQDRKESALSPYLKDVVKTHGEASSIVVAFDLTDAYDLATVRVALDESPAVAAKSVNKEGLAKLITSLRGMTLAIDVTDKMQGTLRADFGLDPSIYKSVLKDVLIEALEDEGAALDDLAAWDATFTDTAMTLKGKFDPAAMARLLTLFEFPSEQDDSAAPQPGDKVNADATKRYFKAVVACIEEVRAFKNKKDYEKTATWHETYARKIDQLSTRNVDPDATKFGLATAERLRGIAGSLRGVPLDVNRLASGAHAYWDRRTVWQGWGGRGFGVRLNTNIPKTREAIAKVVADDAKKRTEIWNQIDTSTADTRAKLTAKHGNGFEATGK